MPAFGVALAGLRPCENHSGALRLLKPKPQNRNTLLLLAEICIISQ